MTTIEALNIIKLARWRLDAVEQEALDTIEAMAIEVEEMRAQMAAQDKVLEDTMRKLRVRANDSVAWGRV